MKCVVSGVLGLMFVLTTAASTVAQGGAPQGRGDGRQGGGQGRGPAAPACMTLACDLQNDWDRTRTLIIGVAEAMPDDKYSYKSTPAQRSFAEQLMHIVQVDGFLLGALAGKTAAPTLNQKAMSKADVLAAVRQSFDYGSAVIKEFNDTQLVERVMPPPFLGPSASRVRIAYYSLQHTQDIYGQMVVYLRLNGITPPASNRGV